MVTNRSLKKVSPVIDLPYAPENKFLSKSEFVARNNKRKEIEAKAKAYADSLKAEAGIEEPVVDVPAVVAEEPDKPKRKYIKKSA